MSEKPKDKKEDTALSIYEDEIVKEMHKCVSAVKNGADSSVSSQQLHLAIEKSHSAPLFNDYEKGLVPTLEIIKNSSVKAADSIASEILRSEKSGVSPKDLVEEKSIEKLLRGREKSINAGVRSYIRSVLRFQTLKERMHLERNMEKQFERADHERRRIHNALIESLQTFTKAIHDAQELDLLNKYTIIEWQPGLRLQHQKDSIVVFSDRILKNRDWVRDWAVVAELYERLAEIEELERK